MTIFVVLADKPNAELGSKIAELYGTDQYQLTDSQWLVAADAIPQSIAEQLGIREGKRGRAIVVSTTGSASGWHSKAAWAWLRQKGATI